MKTPDITIRRPRALGIACAAGAVALGLFYLTLAGAPLRYLGINVGALAIGLAMSAMLGSVPGDGRRWTGGTTIAIAVALLATALLGTKAEGVARWVYVAGLVVQPSLILLPVTLVAFARDRTATATVGVVAAALAIALQPDRAMAGMLVLGLVVLAALRRDRFVTVALAAAVAGFAATLARADALPAMPYVERVLSSSFDAHLAAGVAVWTGSALLLVPAIVGWRRDTENRAAYATFGAVWLAAILAAAVGNYPTPLVGYGGSAIIGYVLSLLGLPRVAGVEGAAGATAGVETGALSDPKLRVRVA